MSDQRDHIERLTETVLPALVARLRASRLGELEVAGDGWRVRLRRDPALRSAAPRAKGALDGADPAPPDPRHSVARSPGVGYFSPAPDMAVGQPVQAGDLLGLVDVLGISQDVRVPEDGIISRLLAEPGQAVEYGQVLAEIDPLEPVPDAAAEDAAGGPATEGLR